MDQPAFLLGSNTPCITAKITLFQLVLKLSYLFFSFEVAYMHKNDASTSSGSVIKNSD